MGVPFADKATITLRYRARQEPFQVIGHQRAPLVWQENILKIKLVTAVLAQPAKLLVEVLEAVVIVAMESTVKATKLRSVQSVMQGDFLVLEHNQAARPVPRAKHQAPSLQIARTAQADVITTKKEHQSVKLVP